MSRSYVIASVLLLMLWLVVAPAAQGTIMHSDVSGTTIDFIDISEGSPTDDPEPLYGQPVVSGDNLVFPTTASFSATSIDGTGSDQTDGKLTFTMMAKPGFTISAFNYSEGGLTTLNGPFVGGDAFTQVVAFAAVNVLEINNTPVTLPTIQSFMAVSPLGGQYQLSTIGGTSFSTGWSGVLNVPLPAGTTKAMVALNNNLFATTLGTGTGAFIDKNSFAIDIDTVVPEPATVALGVMALLGFSLSTSRQRARG
jgi:hypothetical protein